MLQSHNTALMQSLNASQGENTNLCEECAEISDKNATLIKEEHSRKQEVRNAKRSVLRSFNWREKNVDAAVLRGAVAFWGATKVSKLHTETVPAQHNTRHKANVRQTNGR